MQNIYRILFSLLTPLKRKRMQYYRKQKQAMEARREKRRGRGRPRKNLGGQCDRRGRGRPRKTWEDSVIEGIEEDQGRLGRTV
jgi:hypothetical protein